VLVKADSIYLIKKGTRKNSYFLVQCIPFAPALSLVFHSPPDEATFSKKILRNCDPELH
jgi:hypothetical protein